MNLPNKLTLMRVCLVPVFMIIMIADIFPTDLEWLRRLIATVVFVITGLTDMFDGKIARKYNLITNFGKFMDPLADKVGDPPRIHLGCGYRYVPRACGNFGAPCGLRS